MWRFTRNNCITEGFHNKMELINRPAHGFRNFENYRLRVKVLCGWFRGLPCCWRRASTTAFSGILEIPASSRFHWSGRGDLNARPPAPKASARAACCCRHHSTL